MFDVDEALKIVLANIRPLATQRVALDDALFRTLAADIACDLDSPPFDRSLMDGYAVRAVDTTDAPVTLRVVGQIGAGASFAGALERGQAVQINTGAPIPLGADAVVPIEGTLPSADQKSVSIQKLAPSGKAIAKRASYAHAGDRVLAAGSRLTPLNLGVAAAAGAAQVIVYRTPTVSVLSTGTELVEISSTPTGAQIRNSNRHVLDGLFRSAHVHVEHLGVARDDPAEIQAKIRGGLRNDMLCVTGGVSVGAFDFVPHVLKELGGRLLVEKMPIKPGRPTIFASMRDGKPVFALPGNPGSAIVAFELLIRPALAVMQGNPAASVEFLRAALRGTIGSTGGRRSFHPARAELDADGEWRVTPLSWGGSGDMLGMAGANALVMRSPQSPAVKEGEPVFILLLDRL